MDFTKRPANKMHELKEIIKAIDLEKFKKITAKYPKRAENGIGKFCALDKYILRDIKFAYVLNLPYERNFNILDIGTGAGYFPLVCRHYGHTVFTIDIDTYPLFNELTRLFKVDRAIHRVEPFKKLPNLGVKFDLVTALLVQFNNPYSNPWGVEEWNYFLKDLASNQLKENGGVFLFLNKKKNEVPYSEELLIFFRRLRANIRGPNVFLKSLHMLRTNHSEGCP